MARSERRERRERREGLGGSRLEESLEARARRIFRELPALQTPRLTLRRMRSDDAEAMHAYASDPEVARHMLWDPHESLRDSENFLRFVRERYSRGDPAGWGIEDRETGRFIGSCGIQAWSPENARAELGYVLAREHWGRGIMTEAVSAVVGFGFERIGFNRLEARCLDGNAASARVLEKAGMTYEGTSRSSHLIAGHFRDLHHYAVLRDDLR
jgi:ribosomal-protein-alanine N-acetyltransferase